jgi:hypothetical protein
MLQKSEVLNLINTITNEQNKEKLQKYIDLVNSMDSNAWYKFCQEHELDTLDKLKNSLEEKLNYPYILLNELISYEIDKETLIIHLFPKDAHSFLFGEGRIKAEKALIDALEQIQEMMRKDSSITKVYAASGIIQSLIAKMFVRLGFDVKVLPMDQAKEDDELGKFYEQFKNKSDKLGRAQIERDKLLSPEWEELKKGRKKELEEKSKRKIVQNR